MHDLSVGTALLAVLLAGACTRDAPAPLAPQDQNSDPPSTASTPRVTPPPGLQFFAFALADGSDRLLDGVEGPAVDRLRASLDELSAASTGLDASSVRSSLARAYTAVQQLRDDPAWVGHRAADLSAMELVLAQVEEVMSMSDRPNPR